MKKREGFKHLTASDRDRIHALYGHGHDQKDVARVLGVSTGTISRELRRYRKNTWRYSSVKAQADAEEKRQRSKRPGMKIESNPALKRFIIEEVKRLRSPDEIAGRMRREGVTPRVGTAAIYKWLYSEGAVYCRYLCTRRTRKRRQKRASKRTLIPDRISLHKRPESVGLIHAEGDLFVSPTRLRVKTCALLVVEKSSKLLSGSLVANKTTNVIVPAVQKTLGKIYIDDLTLDNGIENVHHGEFGVDTYFCDPGAPYQKPDVERDPLVSSVGGSCRKVPISQKYRTIPSSRSFTSSITSTDARSDTLRRMRQRSQAVSLTVFRRFH